MFANVNPVDLKGDLTRTEMMRNAIAGWKIITINGKEYLPLGRDRIPHRILRGDVTDFLSEPIAYVDKARGFEIITLDPKSKFLAARYQALLIKITQLKLKKYSLQAILDCAIDFIDTDLGGKGIPNLQAKVDAFCKDKNGKNIFYQGEAVIPIDEFVKRKEGVCRHRIMYGVFLLNKLIADGLLPPGTIYTQTDNLGPNGTFGHCWIIYKEEATQKLYLIDPMTFNKAIEVTEDKNANLTPGFEIMRQKILNRFGKRVLPVIPFTEAKHKAGKIILDEKLIATPIADNNTEQSLVFFNNADAITKVTAPKPSINAESKTVTESHLVPQGDSQVEMFSQMLSNPQIFKLLLEIYIKQNSEQSQYFDQYHHANHKPNKVVWDASSLSTTFSHSQAQILLQLLGTRGNVERLDLKNLFVQSSVGISIDKEKPFPQKTIDPEIENFENDTSFSFNVHY